MKFLVTYQVRDARFNHYATEKRTEIVEGVDLEDDFYLKKWMRTKIMDLFDYEHSGKVVIHLLYRLKS